jgi:IclR family mhp operon transcriptional activator
MCERGFVTKGPQRGTYVLTSLVRTLSSGYHGQPRIIEAADEIAVRLTKEVKWPIGIAVFEHDAMVLQLSTIPHSPMSPYHSVLNRRYTMLGSALGRAYLAFCSTADRDLVMEVLKASDTSPDAGLAHEPATVGRILDLTRKCGYSLRDPSERPDSYSIAVPIFDDARVVASMAITWFRSALSVDEAVNRYVAPMKAAARAISEKYNSLSLQASLH